MTDQLTPRERLDQLHRDRQRSLRMFVAIGGLVALAVLILFAAVLWRSTR